MDKIEDFKTHDLPERKFRFWQMIGPGAILVGLSIGAGEIVFWPKLVAEHGAGMVWAAVLGVFLQLWLNFEIGRWTVCTGETTFTGYSRVWRGFAPLFIAFTILGWLAPGWGRVSGTAMKALIVGPAGFGNETFWTFVTFSLVALLLFGPKIAYKSVEITIELLVGIITLGMIIVAIQSSTVAVWSELGRGVVSFGNRPEGISVKLLFIGIVFAGAGGTANLFYSFYLRDKHIGMGALIPAMLNPLRGRTEAMPATGYRFDSTPENARRFRGWMDYVFKDQISFFWFLNTLTILLFIFGALAVLRPANVKLNEGTLIWDEAVVLQGRFGEFGRTLFLLVGVATLFSTQLALVDGVSRSLADIIFTNFKRARTRSVSWWYTLIAGLWIVSGVGITWVMEARGVSDLGFLFNAAYMGGFAMAVYVPLNLYINFKFLPKCARPGIVCTVMNVLASILYIGFAVASILWEIGVLGS